MLRPAYLAPKETTLIYGMALRISGMDAPWRIEISTSLRRNLDKARVAYRHATDEYKRLMDISHIASAPDDPAFRDGHHATQQAMQFTSKHA